MVRMSGIGDKAVVYDHRRTHPVGQPAVFDNNEELDWDNPRSWSHNRWIRAYKVGRAVNFSSDTIGIHTIIARWGGLETSMEIEVLTQSQHEH